jgi:hypothetical protein
MALGVQAFDLRSRKVILNVDTSLTAHDSTRYPWDTFLTSSLSTAVSLNSPIFQLFPNPFHSFQRRQSFLRIINTQRLFLAVGILRFSICDHSNNIRKHSSPFLLTQVIKTSNTIPDGKCFNASTLSAVEPRIMPSDTRRTDIIRCTKLLVKP